MKKQMFAGLIALVATAGIAQAGTITGSIWVNQPGGAVNAIPANIPATPPDVTFSTSAINFSTFEGAGNYTLGGFLNSFNPATVFTGAALLPSIANDTFWVFQGTVGVTNGQGFNVAHDDGLTFLINGATVVGVPGPTAPVVTPFTYTGPTGTFPFLLVYGECCGAPAKLFLDLPNLVGGPVPGQEVPLPGAAWLMGTVLAGAGFGAWRRRRKA